jgi:hypothetical protein
VHAQTVDVRWIIQHSLQLTARNPAILPRSLRATRQILFQPA